MSIRTFALIYGLLFTALGIVGFIPAVITPYRGLQSDLWFQQGAGYLFGVFPVNLPLNLVHLAFGVWGIVVNQSGHAAIGYARSVAIVYAVLAVVGLIPGINTVFGLMPVYGNDVWLHALLAAGAAYFGFVRHAEAELAHRPAARGT